LTLDIYGSRCFDIIGFEIATVFADKAKVGDKTVRCYVGIVPRQRIDVESVCRKQILDFGDFLISERRQISAE